MRSEELKKTLLNETIDDIKLSGHTIEDIAFIGSLDGSYECTFEEFSQLADFTYDSGYGASYIATDLIIMFKSGKMMWRGEYDGSEWWEYQKKFTGSKDDAKKIKKLGGGMWNILDEINDPTAYGRG